MGFRSLLAPPRLAPYLRATSGDEAQALELAQNRADQEPSAEDQPVAGLSDARGGIPAGHIYPRRYTEVVTAERLLRQARTAAGVSQKALADVAGTSQPTLSAYEHGEKSPTLDTAARIVEGAGYELTLTPKVEFTETRDTRGRPIVTPTVLPRLPLAQALATVELPLHLNWSDRGRRYDLRDRRQRARVYEIVLREGGPTDVLAYIDGVLLVDIWNELVLPPAVRSSWERAIADIGDVARSAA